MITGKDRRLARMLPRGRGLWLPVDDSLIAGPVGGLRRVERLLAAEVAQHLNAIICFRGVAQRSIAREISVPIIENVSASTVNINHVNKVTVGTVEGAIRRGADSVAYHLNMTDDSESNGLHVLGLLAEETEKLGVPLTVIVYPRTAGDGNADNNYDHLRRESPAEFTRLVCHGVRIAAELGADVIKTSYTGSIKTFSSVVKSSLGVPVLIAGGPPQGIDTIQLALEALQAGAAGICFGRRVYNSADPLKTVAGLREVVDNYHET